MTVTVKVELPPHVVASIHHGNVDRLLVSDLVIKAVNDDFYTVIPKTQTGGFNATLTMSHPESEAGETVTLSGAEDDGDFTFVDTNSSRSATPTQQAAVFTQQHGLDLPVVFYGTSDTFSTSSASEPSTLRSGSNVFTSDEEVIILKRWFFRNADGYDRTFKSRDPQVSQTPMPRMTLR